MTSEKSVKSPFFRAKIGTMNKKNPQTMYLLASTYISPTFGANDYKKNIVSLDKDLKLSTKDLLRHGSIISSDFLMVTEAPIARVTPGHKVHYIIQVYFRPAEREMLEGKTFKEISDDFSVACSELCANFRDVVEKHGFKCTKTKGTNYL